MGGRIASSSLDRTIRRNRKIKIIGRIKNKRRKRTPRGRRS
jgi:hypothetical protein